MYERSRVIERSIRGKKEWRDKGNLKFSMLQGYDNVYLPDGTKIVRINEEEAKAVRLMFELYADGMSLRKIASKLTREGFKTKKNTEFYNFGICRSLQKLEYAGFTTNSKGEVIKSKVYPPIIDEELWKKEKYCKRKLIRLK